MLYGLNNDNPSKGLQKYKIHLKPKAILWHLNQKTAIKKQEAPFRMPLVSKMLTNNYSALTNTTLKRLRVSVVVASKV